MSNCLKCKKLILEPNTTYGINPNSVCKCDTPVSNQNKEIEELLKRNVYGFRCGACDAGGTDGGLGTCKNCDGHGIVNWQTTDLKEGLETLIAQSNKDLLDEIIEKLPEKAKDQDPGLAKAMEWANNNLLSEVKQLLLDIRGKL